MTAPALSVEIDGVRDVVKAIRKIEDGANDLRQVHGQAARTVEKAASPPVLTGRLAASIRSTGQVGAGVARAGRASVPYAGPIHWGWPARNIKANPFLLTAAEKRTPQIVDIYEKGISALIAQHHLDP